MLNYYLGNSDVKDQRLHTTIDMNSRLPEAVGDEEFVEAHGAQAGAQPAVVGGVVQRRAQRHAQRGVRHQHAPEAHAARTLFAPAHQNVLQD